MKIIKEKRGGWGFRCGGRLRAWYSAVYPTPTLGPLSRERPPERFSERASDRAPFPPDQPNERRHNATAARALLLAPLPNSHGWLNAVRSSPLAWPPRPRVPPYPVPGTGRLIYK